MTNDEKVTAPLRRRQMLVTLGAALAAGVLAACDSDPSDAGAGDDGTSSGSSSGDGSSTGGGSSGAADGTSGVGSSNGSSSGEGSEGETGDPGDCVEASDWAAGGTAAMTMKSCYPNPFSGGAAACTLTCTTTAGPCTTEDTIEREDVSEGLTGLPMRLMFRFVDPDCNPIEGAEVRIWHTKVDGIYSGVTPSGAFCYGDQPEAADEMYFRGSQVTDADGVVAFDSCFPGWYSSRAIHVHFQVTLADATWLISQFIWDDALVAEICDSHPDYSAFGQPDTTSTTDTVFGGTDDLSPYTFEVQRMADGAMLAYKTVTIQSAGPGCEAQSGGGGGPGGGPGGG